MQSLDLKRQIDLKGKTAIITGASSGIGERFAYVLSEAGARTILVSRRIERLKKLSAKLKNSIAIKMDIANKKSVYKDFEKIKDERIDICINCAGISNETAIFGDEDCYNFEDIMQVNVMGTWYVTKCAANHMKKYNIAGSIINIASTAGENYSTVRLSGYSASKAAVIQLTKSLVGELAEHNIRINAISPGMIISPMNDHLLDTEKNRQKHASNVPLGFIGKPSDLDYLLLYLACNEASRYVTGSCITVDGGVTWGG
jgi:NAD(P)-dependent dehydrogenase (short-subunit alcohol dehydrogenase family)